MRKKMKRWLASGLKSLLIIAILLGNTCSSIPPEELKASIELVDIDTRWEKKLYQPWPPKLILVPAISFKIKNIGEKPLGFISCNGIFKIIDENKNLGDNFVSGIGRKAVQPGETSDTISLQSFQGVEGKNLKDFKTNPGWRPVEVKIFIKHKGSQYILIGRYDISKKINFSEPAPLEPPKAKKKEEEKK